MLIYPLQDAKKLLIRHEGMRFHPYRDSAGKLTIGVGRNLDDRGVTESEALHLLANDIVFYFRELSEKLPWFLHLDDVRQLGLLSMAFNMGTAGVLQFHVMLQALADKRWTDAANAAMDSKWRSQVGHRAIEIADIFRTGVLPQ